MTDDTSRLFIASTAVIITITSCQELQPTCRLNGAGEEIPGMNSLSQLVFAIEHRHHGNISANWWIMCWAPFADPRGSAILSIRLRADMKSQEFSLMCRRTFQDSRPSGISTSASGLDTLIWLTSIKSIFTSPQQALGVWGTGQLGICGSTFVARARGRNGGVARSGREPGISGLRVSTNDGVSNKPSLNFMGNCPAELHSRMARHGQGRV